MLFNKSKVQEYQIANIKKGTSIICIIDGDSYLSNLLNRFLKFKVYSNVEIIIIDHCITQNESKKIKDIVLQYSTQCFIRLIKGTQSCTISDSYNYVAQKARYNYLCIINHKLPYSLDILSDALSLYKRYSKTIVVKGKIYNDHAIPIKENIELIKYHIHFDINQENMILMHKKNINFFKIYVKFGSNKNYNTNTNVDRHNHKKEIYEPENADGKQNNKVKRKQIDDLKLLNKINKYKRNRNLSKNKVVVYTAISNNYDVLKIPQELCSDWDYICFTDRDNYPGEHPWKFINFDYIHHDPTRTARFVKTNPHRYFSDYEYSVWIDAHILINNKFIINFINDFIESNKLFAAIPHPMRNCTYDEADKCIEEKLDDKNIINNQMENYKKQNFPKHYGLIETQILIRKHNNSLIRNLNTMWWSEIDKYSKRDQLSLMYTLWKNSIDWSPILPKGSSTRNHHGFMFFEHGLKKSHRISTYHVPSFLPRKFISGQKPYWYKPKKFNNNLMKSYYNSKVDIILCVHNALEDVKNCLQSVYLNLLPNHNVIIVDDGSDKSTHDYLRTFADIQNFKLIRHDKPKGYTKSANIGIKASNAPFVILLNSDTIVCNNWVLKLLQAANSGPDVGVVGPISNAASWQSVPLLRDPNHGGMMINSLPTGLTISEMDQLCEKYGWFNLFPKVPLINGFCYGINRNLINTIGYFDEKAFPNGYGEEDDYSMRALDAGFSLVIATHCYIYHAKSKSFGTERRSALATDGGKLVRERHGEHRINRAVQTMKEHPLLTKLRTSLCKACNIVHNQKSKDTLPEIPRDKNDFMHTTRTNKIGNYDYTSVANVHPSIYPQEISLADITLIEIKNNEYFINKMKERQLDIPKKIIWFLPAFKNILAGGIRTIFLVANNFTNSWNTKNIFVVYQTHEQPSYIDQNTIINLFPNLRFELHYLNKEDDPLNLPQCDIAFCTSWPTAYMLARYNKCYAKFYFMQDYEPLFVEAGSLQAIIKQTYKFGFYCIANTKGIANHYKEYSSDVQYFTPGIDRNIFYPPRKKHTGPPWQVVFYARPEKSRNGFVLGVQALTEVKQYLGKKVKILSAGNKWDPKKYALNGIVENLGVLNNLEDVAELYRKSHVGLILMLTPHPSYQPFEFMACGCATVTNYNQATSWFFKNNYNCLTSKNHPSEIALNILKILEHPELRNKIVQGGLNTVKNMDWDSAFKQIQNYIVSPYKQY